MRRADWFFPPPGYLALLLVIVLLSGCGAPPVADVSGTVTLNGKAPNLDGLHINFMGKDGRPVTAAVGKDGTFKATGVSVGEVGVGLAHSPPEAAAAMDRIAQGRTSSPEDLAKGPDGKIDPRKIRPVNQQPRPGGTYKSPIPERVRDPRTSGKTLTVEAGKQNVLTWDVLR